MVLLSKLFYFTALPFTVLGNSVTPKDDYDYDYYIKKFPDDDPIRFMLKHISTEKPVYRNVYLMRQILRERRLRAEELSRERKAKANDIKAGVAAAVDTGLQVNGDVRERIGKIIIEKDEVGKYREVLVVRTRIEYLEEELLPPGVPKPRTRREIWVLILHSRNPKAEEIRERVLNEYGRDDPDTSISLFAEALQKVYGDVSGGVHQVVDQNVLDDIVDGDERVEKNILNVLRLQQDMNIKKALKIVAKPLPLPNMNAVRGVENEYLKFTCVEIFPLGQSTTSTSAFKTPFTEDDVEKCFPMKKPKFLEINPPDKKVSRKTSITVWFDNNEDAIEAFNKNHGWVAKNQVRMQLSRCKDIPKKAETEKPAEGASSPDQKS